MSVAGAGGRGDARALRADWLGRLEVLHPAVVADCLDKLGLREQVMAPHIRPLYPHARIAGFAVTVEIGPVDTAPADRRDWYRGELEAVDSLRSGDVMVVSTCAASYWGELLATACRYKGVRGLVADAYTRDSLKIIAMEFPTFVAGISAYDSLGRIDVRAVRGQISCGGVLVNTGDLVLADHDGVVVIPDAVAEQVLVLAAAKLTGEDLVRRELAAGVPVATVFQAYGII